MYFAFVPGLSLLSKAGKGVVAMGNWKRNEKGSRTACLLAFLCVFPHAQTPIRVLFLGGTDGQPAHDPKALWDTLSPVLTANGMIASYRDTQTVLNKDSLKQYDVVFAYTADHGKGTAGGSDLTTAQEDAIIGWVDSGHVLVAFHGSTNTYLNNTRWTNLLGAVFLDHGNGASDNGGTITFKQPLHASLVGTTPLPASATSSGGQPYWDEGRRHKNFVTDTLVIARSRMNTTDTNTPWIWVRPQGRGWVYYNSSGHDGQTWKRPEWKGQVIQALKWGFNISQSYTAIHFNDPVKNISSLQDFRVIRVLNVAGETVQHKNLPAGAYHVEVSGSP